MDWNTHSLFNGKEEEAIRLVQLSDLHLKSFNYPLKMVVKKMVEKKPDVIVFTGDSVDDSDKLGELEKLLKELPLETPKFAILGNWEYWGKVDLDKLSVLYAKYNCQLLVNEHARVSVKGRELAFIGLDDLVGGTPDVSRAFQDLGHADQRVVLAHCPESFQEIGEVDFDLMLSGHTHGGQVNVLGWVPFKPVGSGAFLKGWYMQGDKRLYVSKGIGTSMIPVRFGARAEVAEFLI